MIHIDEIALALGNICRFGGKLWSYYSVAEHCVHVSRMFTDPRLAMAGLIHDATEAYMGDMVTPLKQIIPQFEEIENKLHKVIFTKFGLEPEDLAKIDWADKEAVVIEARQLTPGAWTKDIEVTQHFKVESWTPEDAKRKFLLRYWELKRLGE